MVGQRVWRGSTQFRRGVLPPTFPPHPSKPPARSPPPPSLPTPRTQILTLDSLEQSFMYRGGPPSLDPLEHIDGTALFLPAELRPPGAEGAGGRTGGVPRLMRAGPGGLTVSIGSGQGLKRHDSSLSGLSQSGGEGAWGRKAGSRREMMLASGLCRWDRPCSLLPAWVCRVCESSSSLPTWTPPPRPHTQRF